MGKGGGRRDGSSVVGSTQHGLPSSSSSFPISFTLKFSNGEKGEGEVQGEGKGEVQGEVQGGKLTK